MTESVPCCPWARFSIPDTAAHVLLYTVSGACVASDVMSLSYAESPLVRDSVFLASCRSTCLPVPFPRFTSTFLPPNDATASYPVAPSALSHSFKTSFPLFCISPPFSELGSPHRSFPPTHSVYANQPSTTSHTAPVLVAHSTINFSPAA